MNSMKMQKGFTLIELMIVVAIIAIIAAIAIPNLMQSRMQANETNAVAAVKTYGAAQATWSKANYSERAAKNTFIATADQMGFTPAAGNYTSGTNPIRRAYAFPYSDLYNLSDNAATPAAVALIAPTFANAISEITAWNGYYFMQGFVQKANPNQFDLFAIPAVYAQTGNNSFYMDQKGDPRMSDVGPTDTPKPPATNSDASKDAPKGDETYKKAATWGSA